MNVGELPLVAFTILAQLSVGSFVVLGIVHLVARRRVDAAALDKLSDPALYAIGPAMVLGLIASMAHLGNPINALYTIGHLQTSWLSREILLGSAFAGLGAAFAVVQWLKWLTPLLRQLLAGLTAVVGLGLVYVMSMVYLLPTVPAWDSWATPVSFFTTTFLLGSLAVGAAFVVVYTFRARRAVRDETTAVLLRGTLRGIATASIALLGVEFVVIPAYALSLGTQTGAGGAAHESLTSLMVAGGAVFIARAALVFVGAGLLGFLLHRFATAGRERQLVLLATSAFALVLISETLGRILFYGSFANIGL